MSIYGMPSLDTAKMVNDLQKYAFAGHNFTVDIFGNAQMELIRGIYQGFQMLCEGDDR